MQITTHHYQRYYISYSGLIDISLYDWSLDSIGFNPTVINKEAVNHIDLNIVLFV